MKRLLTILAVTMLCLNAIAQEAGETYHKFGEWIYVVLDENAKTCKIGANGAEGPILAYDKSMNGNDYIGIPDKINDYTVVEINDEAFAGCQLMQINIPPTVKIIGNGAFKNSTIARINLPTSITSVGKDIFEGCKALTEVRLETTTPPEASGRLFSLDDPLETPSNAVLYVPYGSKAAYAAAAGWSDFQYCGGIIDGSEEDENIQTATIDGIEWHYVVLDEDAKTCKVGGKTNDPNKSRYAIDQSITGAITVPDVINGYTVVEIYKSAFKKCKVTSVVVSGHVRVIGKEAFEDCHNLVSLELPASLISMGHESLDDCENLAEMIIHATTPPEADGDVIGVHHEEGTTDSPNARLHVPVGCKAAYSVAEGWTDFLLCRGIVEDIIPDTNTGLTRIFPEKASPSDVVRIKIVGSYDLSYSNQPRVALRNTKGDIEGKWDIEPGFDIKNIGSLDEMPEAVFDLRTADLGKYDIVVGDMILKNAFELVASDGSPNVTVVVNGRNEIMLGRDNIYSIDFFNNSNVAAYNTPFTLFVSDKNGIIDLSFDFPIECYGEDIPQAVKDFCKDYENGVVIDTQYGPMRGYMLNIPYIAPHGEAHYTFRIRQKEEDTTNQELLMVYACGTPLGAYDPDLIESARTRETLSFSGSDQWDPDMADCLIRYFGGERNPRCIFAVNNVIFAMRYVRPLSVTNLATMLYAATRTCTGSPLNPNDFRLYFMNIWKDVLVVRVGCLVIIKRHHWIFVRNSCDPNEMIGPAGYDDQAHYIQPIHNMSYMITYENKSTATAPAHEVFINDQLDASAYDLSTFGFNAFGWAGKVWQVGGSKTKEFTRDINETVNGTDIIVRVSGKFNENTGEVNWSMLSLDKDGKEIDDPNIGYLVPNNDNGDGEGFVSFSIEHKANPANGSTVSNKATIVFDANKPIETNTYVNTFDTDYPTSTMTKVEQNGDNLVLTYEGSDATSGVYSYNIYVFKDGGEAELLAADVRENTYSMPYDPKVNYAFCVIATDNVGWNEAKDIKPEMEFVTGINNITISAKTPWTVYASDGRTVSMGEGAINLSLPGGVYIVRIGDNVRKVIVR